MSLIKKILLCLLCGSCGGSHKEEVLAYSPPSSPAACGGVKKVFYNVEPVYDNFHEV